MIADEGKPDSAADRRHIDPVIHADGQADEGAALMGPETLGKLVTRIGVEELTDSLFSFALQMRGHP